MEPRFYSQTVAPNSTWACNVFPDIEQGALLAYTERNGSERRQLAIESRTVLPDIEQDAATKMLGFIAHWVSEAKRPRFPIDIWIIILNELWASEGLLHPSNPLFRIRHDHGHMPPAFLHWARSLRVVSKEFKLIIDPLIYEVVQVTDYTLERMNLVNTRSLSLRDYQTNARFKINVISHCKCLVFLARQRLLGDQNFRAHELTHIIRHCRRLVKFTWLYEWKQELLPHIVHGLMSCVQDMLQAAPRCVLDFDQNRADLEATNLDGTFWNRTPETSPARYFEMVDQSLSTHQTSLQITSCLCNRDYKYPNLMLDRSLKVTHLNIDDHCCQATLDMFDFSILNSLKFHRGFPTDVLERLLPSAKYFLSNLKVFELEDDRSHGPNERLSSNSREHRRRVHVMWDFIQRLVSLESLEILSQRWVTLIPPYICYGLGKSLQSLTFLENHHTGKGRLTAENLQQIAIHCPHLLILSIDWPENTDQQADTLESICGFKKLIFISFTHYASLNIRGIDYSGEFNGPSQDPTWPYWPGFATPHYIQQRAMIVLRRLHSHKKGCKLEMAELRVLGYWSYAILRMPDSLSHLFTLSGDQFEHGLMGTGEQMPLKRL